VKRFLGLGRRCCRPFPFLCKLDRLGLHLEIGAAVVFVVPPIGVASQSLDRFRIGHEIVNVSLAPRVKTKLSGEHVADDSAIVVTLPSLL
jgi:hypothetical protein